MAGGVKSGAAAEIWARFSPEAKPVVKAAFDAAAEDCSGISARLPGEAEAGFPTDALIVRQRGMEASHNCLIVGLGGIVRNGRKRIAQTRKTIRLANGIGVVLETQGERDLQVRLDAKFILTVEAQGIESERLSWPDRVGLLVSIHIAGIETA